MEMEASHVISPACLSVCHIHRCYRRPPVKDRWGSILPAPLWPMTPSRPLLLRRQTGDGRDRDATNRPT